MSEEKKENRKVEVIQQEYQNLCMKAGHLQYSIKCHKDDLALVNEQLRELNLEAASSHAASVKESELAKEQSIQEEPKELVNGNA